MEKLSTEQQNKNVSYKNKNVKTAVSNDNIAIRYKDISERIQKLGVAFMMLSDTLRYPQSQISVEFENIGMSLIRDCVFYESMSFIEEENVLYGVVRGLDTADRFMRALYALSKISPMNFILIHKELASNKSRVASQLEYLRSKRGNAGLFSSMKFSEQQSITDKLEDLLLVKNDGGESGSYVYPKSEELLRYEYGNEKQVGKNVTHIKKENPSGFGDNLYKNLENDSASLGVSPHDDGGYSHESGSLADPAGHSREEGSRAVSAGHSREGGNLAVQLPMTAKLKLDIENEIATIPTKTDIVERTMTPALILRRQVITDLIKTRGAVTMSELHNDLPDINKKTLSRDLIELSNEGIISTVKNGRWTVYRIL